MDKLLIALVKISFIFFALPQQHPTRKKEKKSPSAYKLRWIVGQLHNWTISSPASWLENDIIKEHTQRESVYYTSNADFLCFPPSRSEAQIFAPIVFLFVLVCVCVCVCAASSSSCLSLHTWRDFIMIPGNKKRTWLKRSSFFDVQWSFSNWTRGVVPIKVSTHNNAFFFLNNDTMTKKSKQQWIHLK